ncbi:Indole-3-acetic acid-induced protein ARG7 [Senna tora]|uniref:Indole-3-acetic acid-induced protein ARG7 n=1 Tax=Senna tora TaxID=362788 RepID=A0A835CDK3_9FABA|nr:Indole-3-acetic acid-induced protein ARG7 [Senna tora]
MLQKWQSVTLGSKLNHHHHKTINKDIAAAPINIIKKEEEDDTWCDSEDEEIMESTTSPKVGPPADVPKGYLAVYVGCDLQRFIIPTAYLSHSIFKELLEKAEDEFGFEHSGALTIPCDIHTFKSLLTSMHNPQPHPTCTLTTPPHPQQAQEPLMA